MKKVILFLFGLVLITSCTENQQAKQWGGTAFELNVILFNFVI